MNIKKNKIHLIVRNIFSKYKLSNKHAKICADAIINAELVGAHSHGLSRLKMHCDRIKKKVINPKPKKGKVYNMGGGRFSNCSIIEALNLVESLANIKITREIIKKPRVGDHIWYISNLSKFKKHYPNWKQKYNTKKIIEELIAYQK